MASLRPVEVFTPGGIYLGRSVSLNVDHARILRTVERTVRGLFYHAKKRPLPEGVTLAVYSVDSLTDMQPFYERFMPLLQNEPVREIGKEVFKYRSIFDDAFPDNAVFQLGFFERFHYFSLIFRPDEKSTAAIS